MSMLCCVFRSSFERLCFSG